MNMDQIQFTVQEVQFKNKKQLNKKNPLEVVLP